MNTCLFSSPVHCENAGNLKVINLQNAFYVKRIRHTGSVYYRPLSRKLRFSSFPGQNDIYFTYLILKNYLFFNVAIKYFMFMNVAARGLNKIYTKVQRVHPNFFFLNIYEINDTHWSFNIISHRVHHLFRQLCLRFKIGSYLHFNFTNTDLHHRDNHHTNFDFFHWQMDYVYCLIHKRKTCLLSHWHLYLVNRVKRRINYRISSLF